MNTNKNTNKTNAPAHITDKAGYENAPTLRFLFKDLGEVTSKLGAKLHRIVFAYAYDVRTGTSETNPYLVSKYDHVRKSIDHAVYLDDELFNKLIARANCSGETGDWTGVFNAKLDWSTTRKAKKTKSFRLPYLLDEMPTPEKALDLAAHNKNIRKAYLNRALKKKAATAAA